MDVEFPTYSLGAFDEGGGSSDHLGRRLECNAEVRMKRVFFAMWSCALLTISGKGSANVGCTLTNFDVDAYHHAGTYLHGYLNGAYISFLNICGETAGAQDCASKATDRRLAIALAAQAQGKPLLLYFWNQTACSQVVPYTVVVSVQVAH
jgi:hypothetical protein